MFDIQSKRFFQQYVMKFSHLGGKRFKNNKPILMLNKKKYLCIEILCS